jgi:hypothetical protein
MIPPILSTLSYPGASAPVYGASKVATCRPDILSAMAGMIGSSSLPSPSVDEYCTRPNPFKALPGLAAMGMGAGFLYALSKGRG